MCDVCGAEGLDWKFTNGNKKLQKAYFYKVYVGQVASVKLCHIHDIELFQLGETRFLKNHLPLARKMASGKASSESIF